MKFEIKVHLLLSLSRQLVKDIYSFKKIPIREKELEKSVMDNWKYVFGEV